ncbi:MAG: dihydroorotate dehydrogenase electron transfer subunit [Acidobacteria bacterium]|nr:dihydroorotate dehydrogenase electron transfer subunit [Acidobacteriota bacterium]|tara:strand:- start:453 stop:1271 length:819 start_codon:yes stop_codon:yes gene_type:complete
MPVDVDAVVISNTKLSDFYNVVAVAAPDVARQARPGQFVMVKPDKDYDPLLRRPFSVFEILRDPAGRVSGFSLLNKRIGVTTRRLYDITPGERLQCLGPLGQAFESPAADQQAWMVAGGVGLAPFLTLAESLVERLAATRLFYGGRSADDLFYLETFEALGVRLELTTDDGSRGHPGLVTGPLHRALDETDKGISVRLYACGPTPMMQAVTELAATHGRSTDVSLEQVMGCGLGGCYSCVVPVAEPGQPTRFVRSCLQGPVFDGGRIDWDQL